VNRQAYEGSSARERNIQQEGATPVGQQRVALGIEEELETLDTDGNLRKGEGVKTQRRSGLGSLHVTCESRGIKKTRQPGRKNGKSRGWAGFTGKRGGELRE